MLVAINREIKQKEPAEEVPLKQLREPQKGMGTSCTEGLIRVKILPDDNRKFQIGASIEDFDMVEILLFLVQVCLEPIRGT